MDSLNGDVAPYRDALAGLMVVSFFVVAAVAVEGAGEGGDVDGEGHGDEFIV